MTRKTVLSADKPRSDISEAQWPYSPAASRELLTPEQWIGVADALGITPRELEIIVLLLESKTREAVARTLHISTRTVRQHLERIYQKLGVSDRVELVLCIMHTRDELMCRDCPYKGDLSHCQRSCARQP
jgi:DNA-binding CsgD family transcriptional regulator